MKKIVLSLFFAILLGSSAFGSYILIPMNEDQTDHLKAYGLTYWILQHEAEAWWLLNYEGGSFAYRYNSIFEKQCKVRNVRYQVIADGKFNQIISQIASPEANMDAIKLEAPPKVAVIHRRLMKKEKPFSRGTMP